VSLDHAYASDLIFSKRRYLIALKAYAIDDIEERYLSGWVRDRGGANGDRGLRADGAFRGAGGCGEEAKNAGQMREFHFVFVLGGFNLNSKHL